MKALARASHDEIATANGGWAKLCAPEFVPTVQLYAEFESCGLSKSQLDDLIASQKMPARQRALIDTAENLLRIWVRSLCGFIEREKAVFTGEFTDLKHLTPVFLSENAAEIAFYDLTADELELFIQNCIAFTGPAISDYVAARTKRIAALARLCIKHPDNAGDEPDPDNALVPRKPKRPGGSETNALPLPAESANLANDQII